jgi:hypothetical protein
MSREMAPQLWTGKQGLDLFLQAYADAFLADNDMTLVIKETGASSFYAHNRLLPQIRRLARQPKVAPVILMKDPMEDSALPICPQSREVLVGHDGDPK